MQARIIYFEILNHITFINVLECRLGEKKACFGQVLDTADQHHHPQTHETGQRGRYTIPPLKKIAFSELKKIRCVLEC